MKTPQNEVVLSYSAGSAEKRSLKAELQSYSKVITEIPLVIGGERITKKDQLAQICPHDKRRTVAQSSYAAPSDLKAAIENAIAAQKDWASLPWEERASVFLKAADLLSGKYRQKINAATMIGQSKTCFQAEIDAACELADFFRFNVAFAQSIYEEQALISPKGMWNRSQVRPLEGFILAIAPFNFTSISINLAAAPALMGNTVLWKPAPGCALSSYVGMELLQEAGLPPGVINFIQADPLILKETVLKHHSLGGIHFTGSTATFRYLWQEVANNIASYKSYPRLVGETGGKDFIFAHESADPEQLLIALLRGAFEYQGQKCSAASRAYIEEDLFKKIKDGLVSKTEALPMGNPEDFKNFMGAVIDERAYKKITSYIEDAKNSKDASILCGGVFSSEEGFFVRPTIILANNPNYKSMTEEIFGPVLTIYVYKRQNFEQVLELCDASPYALTGAIFARDRAVIANLSKKLVNAAGNFYINDKPTGAVVGQQPFGGARASGTNDKAGSVLNLLRWVSFRTIKENFISFAEHTYPHMQES